MPISRAGISTSPTRHGFTLLEVLLALSLAGIGLLGLIQWQLTSLKAAEQADSRLAAVTVAHSVLAHLALEPVLAWGGHEGQTAVNGRTFFWTARVAPVREPALSVSAATRLRRVTVTVRWDPDPDGPAVELAELQPGGLP